MKLMKRVWGLLAFILFCVQMIWAQENKPSGSAEALSLKVRPKGEVVSEAVAQAGSHVITSREVLISNILDQALATPHKKGITPPRTDWLLPATGEAFSRHLAQVLLEIVVQMEAENFSIGQVSQVEVLNNEKHIQDMVKGWQPWVDLEVSSGEMQQMILRKLRAKNFLNFKMESSGVQISDEEARAFYEKNRVRFGNLPFAQFKAGIKEVLAQKELQEKLKGWFDILKRKYRVRYLGGAG
jgi:hypothetical protein